MPSKSSSSCRTTSPDAPAAAAITQSIGFAPGARAAAMDAARRAVVTDPRVKGLGRVSG
jgi:hypothetical protein